MSWLYSVYTIIFFIYLYATVAPKECFDVNTAEGAGGTNERAWNREVAIQSG